VRARSRQRWILPALAVTVAASLACAWRLQTHAVQNDLSLQQCLGQVLAQQAAQVLGKQGRILMITPAPTQTSGVEIQTEAFKAELIKLGDYEVRQYNLTNALPARHLLGMGLTWAEYQLALRSNAEVDLAVSFAGAPALSDPEPGAPANAPRLIAECLSATNLRTLFARNLIAAAIVPRAAASEDSGAHSGPELVSTRWHGGGDCFMRRYQIITPPLASSLLAR